MEQKDFEKIYNDYVNQNSSSNGSEQEQQSEKEEIVAVRKNEDGDIIAFKSKSGRELDYVTALEEAKAGKISHIDVFHKYGRDIIRSEPDGIEVNNLDNLPLF
ncbi:DUF3892 domain-containing protein [Caldibacillus thermoamylovorans]|uniref:DUF3892 domain-containing protein n=1 Tax=Bacillaceae TaxID=186817 RepID=UPI001D065267|nr:DUF3892 domain-containing protein [Caldibacillus thermoamylovorans]MCB5936731.1 DUF3892 domain-containing protein [Bacillus sp. DFI.2.34]MCB7078737.1 DUF3892 domain-containing protein [Caldibacillus thermoamylovorans]MDL0420484.1 DUF3892 domain-containing protein [Caldibacillus thermoamylovorans]